MLVFFVIWFIGVELEFLFKFFILLFCSFFFVFFGDNLLGDLEKSWGVLKECVLYGGGVLVIGCVM